MHTCPSDARECPVNHSDPSGDTPIPVSRNMSWKDIIRPPQVAALPVDARTGFPIFFLMQPPPGRVLDFKLYNPIHKLRCGLERLCMVCGQPLPYWLWFLGGEADLDNGVCGDPPLHWDCANYSVQVCPFLTSTRLEFASGRGAVPAQPHTAGGRDRSRPRPDTVVLGKTRGYTLARHGAILSFVLRPLALRLSHPCDGSALGPEPRQER